MTPAGTRRPGKDVSTPVTSPLPPGQGAAIRVRVRHQAQGAGSGWGAGGERGGGRGAGSDVDGGPFDRPRPETAAQERVAPIPLSFSADPPD